MLTVNTIALRDAIEIQTFKKAPLSFLRSLSETHRPRGSEAGDDISLQWDTYAL